MWVMSRDGYLLGSPAGDAMPLAMSGSSTGIKIGHQPLQAAVGASGAGWNVGSCVLECDDAALPSLASSWWLQNARLSLCSGRRELHWLHMAVEEDEDAMNRSDICLQRLAISTLGPDICAVSRACPLLQESVVCKQPLAGTATPRCRLVDRPEHQALEPTQRG